jgi:hypothetical protein
MISLYLNDSWYKFVIYSTKMKEKIKGQISWHITATFNKISKDCFKITLMDSIA